MNKLFPQATAGWRWEPHRRCNPKEWQERLQQQIKILSATPTTAPAELHRRKRAIARVAATNGKRPSRVLRRANPRSLEALEVKMKRLCLDTARARKLDFDSPCWFFKAEIAALLGVPEHFVTQVAHRWNLAGVCGQGENNGVHDSHRARPWGGPWVSAWRDTCFTLDLKKLQALAL